jgi:hypothetical protein
MTLKIIKGQTSRLVVTLSELANPDNPNNWFFVFKKDQGAQVYKTYLNDMSSAPLNYNEFYLDETDLNMMTGDYEYRAYQMPNGGSEDESIGLEVEIGKARVIKVPVTVTTYTKTQTEVKGYERA